MTVLLKSFAASPRKMAAGITKPMPAAGVLAVMMTMIAANTKPLPKARYRYEWPPPRFGSAPSRLSSSLTTPPNHSRPDLRALGVILDLATLDSNGLRRFGYP